VLTFAPRSSGRNVGQLLVGTIVVAAHAQSARKHVLVSHDALITLLVSTDEVSRDWHALQMLLSAGSLRRDRTAVQRRQGAISTVASRVSEHAGVDSRHTTHSAAAPSS
jgi:hypothetical protein